MKIPPRKLLLPVSLVSLFFLVALAKPSPVRAQSCPVTDPICLATDAACVAGTTLRNYLNMTVNQCVNLFYPLMVAMFNPPAPPPPQPWYDPTLQEFQQRVFDQTNPDEIFGERYTYAQVKWILHSLYSILTPPVLSSRDPQDFIDQITDIVDGIERVKQLLSNREPVNGTDLAFLRNLGFLGESYAFLLQAPNIISFSPPASAINEVKIVAQRLNILSPVYAQGTGYQRLSMANSLIRPLWTATRNIAYLIATVLIIASGFMVMLRTRISPQLSVTVQMIIPRIVITLFLVTFSFAIAGFVIDLAFVAIGAFLGFISLTQAGAGITIIQDLPTAIAQLTGGFDFVWHFLSLWIILSIILIVLAVVAGIAFGLATGGFVVLIIGFILGFFIWSLYVWGRILGQLVVAFITLNLLIIAGPIMIIFDILPTSSGGFKKWLLCLIGNSSVFVMYAILAVIGDLAFNIRVIPGFAETPRLWADNPLVMPVFVYPSNNIFISYLVFMGFMTIVPNIVASVRNMFCKTADVSDFIERAMKDTIGQLTTAGQNVNKALEQRGQATATTVTNAGPQGGGGGEATGAAPRGTASGATGG